jgi:uncharacterized membrane protein (UPF0127 family)
MQRVNQRRTKLAPRRWIIIVSVLIGLAIVAGVGFFIAGRGQPAAPATVKLVLTKGTPAAREYTLENAVTPAIQEKGLSGRSGLAKGTGMIFSYENPTEHCMWMKDMKFNIDIVWLDANKRITSIVSNLNPTTYPQKYCAISKYVVELASGEARANGLRVGQIVDL